MFYNLKNLNNLNIIIIIINSDLRPTYLLSNQIGCWEGGKGGGYPLPNHPIWLDNKYNIYPLIYIHSYISTHIYPPVPGASPCW